MCLRRVGRIPFIDWGRGLRTLAEVLHGLRGRFGIGRRPSRSPLAAHFSLGIAGIGSLFPAGLFAELLLGLRRPVAAAGALLGCNRLFGTDGPILRVRLRGMIAGRTVLHFAGLLADRGIG